MILSRRLFVSGGLATITAPAIVRAASLMPVKTLIFDTPDPFAAWDYRGNFTITNGEIFTCTFDPWHRGRMRFVSSPFPHYRRMPK